MAGMEPPATGPGSRARVAEDVPFLGRTPAVRVLVTVVSAGAVVAGGAELSSSLNRDLPMILALISMFVCVPLILALPAWLSMRREQWVVLHGTRLRARIVSCDLVGRTGPNMCYAIARLSLQVDVPGRAPVDAFARRVVYSIDRRDISKLVGRELWVYWHASRASLAVPEEPL